MPKASKNINDVGAESVPVAAPVERSKKTRRSKKPFVVIIVVVIIAVIIGLIVSANRPLVSKNGSLSEKQIERVVKKLGKHILLPEGTGPLVAAIIDANQLKQQQAFYAEAENGDVLLIYSAAEKAIIYNPREDIIVNVGPVVFEGDSINGEGLQGQ